jgi:ABC-type lipoprotein release transport system permease subunit
MMKSKTRSTGLVRRRARPKTLLFFRIIVAVGVAVSVGVIVVVRARTRIAHLQSERRARWF